METVEEYIYLGQRFNLMVKTIEKGIHRRVNAGLVAYAYKSRSSKEISQLI